MDTRHGEGVRFAFMASDLAGTTTVVPTADLNYFHRNPRKGDVAAIKASLVAHGQYTPIIVNVGGQTGRPNEVLAGNHTLRAIRELAESHDNPFDVNATAFRTVKVQWVDVDDEGADRVMLADNQTWELGEGVDQKLVFDMLSEIGTTGTGYSDDEMDALDKMLADAEPREPDPPALPPEKAERAIGYTIVFDDSEQEGRWFEFVRWLKSQYPAEETIAERLVAHLTHTAGERV